MNREEALVLLKCHAFAFEDIEQEKMTNGFLGMLRPFSGQLVEDNFHEVMAIILLEDGGTEEAFWGYEEYKRERNK